MVKKVVSEGNSVAFLFLESWSFYTEIVVLERIEWIAAGMSVYAGNVFRRNTPLANVNKRVVFRRNNPLTNANKQVVFRRNNP